MATQRCIASIKTPYIHQRDFPGHRLGKTRFSHNHKLRVTDESAGLDLTRPNRHTPFGTVRIPRKSLSNDISIGIACLVRTQTDVLKGSRTQAERTCRTRSAKSFALEAFTQECFPLRSCFKNSELGQRTVERQPSERWTPISNIRPVTFEMF
jgi:hypothetical protein